MNWIDCPMWFGTMEYSQEIEPPLSGADSSPDGWTDDGVFLGGDGYAVNSFNTHKVYVYSWAGSSSREMAQLMQSYRSGTYGRGKIYFVEPTIYDTNVLPAKWADPSITLDYEGPSLVPGVVGTPVNTSSFSVNRLPVKSVYYDLSNEPAVITLNDSNSVFIPIPDGMQLNLGAFYSSTTTNVGVFAITVTGSDSQIGFTRLTPKSTTDPNLFGNVITKVPGAAGVRLFIGKFLAGGGTVTVSAIHARLSPVGVIPEGPAYWIGGQGHGGCRFVGTPTYITNNGVDGGQIEFAATFREVLN